MEKNRALQDKVERLKAALRESQANYRTLFNRVANPVFIFDRESYSFLTCNAAALRTYGYSMQEIRHMTPPDLHPPEDSDALQRNLPQKNVDRPNVYTHIAKDGRRMTVEILTNEIEYQGRPAWISIVHDVSERSRTEEDLREARRLAEAASRSKGEFLANVSHEIRTPMNAIIGMTELALGTELDSEQREYLEIVRLSSESLLALLNDILDFSKIEAGKLGLDPLEFGLRDSLRDTLRTLMVRAEEKDLVLACHIAPGIPERVVADPGRLRQILVNLVGNAIKFTEKGQIVLRVEVESRSKNRVLLHFSVADSGGGIPPDKQQKIFEAFAQADGSITRIHGGTGLGLAISSQLASLMGGRIWVESEVGVGSTFRFTIDCGLGTGAGRLQRRAVDLKGLRVLLVDDLLINQRIAGEILLSWKMKVTVADRGVKALAALRSAVEQKCPYQVVILDAQLPVLDGFEVAARIRSEARLASTTLVMLTSSAQRGDAARCRELGVDAYLTKPLIQSDLLDAIRTALSRGRARRQEAPPELITRHSLRESRPHLDVLLAEDNAINQKLALRLLEKRGHRVTLANNGKEALERFRQGKFDVILMDVQMPVMDGLAATESIREMEAGHGSRIPIIAMTALAMTGDRDRCLAAGMDDYVSKPIKPTTLYETIERLAGRISRRGAETQREAAEKK
ncbi:MAG: response regulator [Acidobacteriota bacterium]